MDQRLEALHQWLQSIKTPFYQLEPASADASFRRYFRLYHPDQSSSIIMDAPPDKENCQPYVQIAQLLNQVGVHAPQIQAQNLEQGFLILEDLGDQLYLDALNQDTVERLYGDAIGALITMQACIDADELPLYDEALLRAEMDLFQDWLLQKHLGWELSGAELDMLQNSFDLLVQSALEQPQVFVHRDYHSRNLTTGLQHNPGVLDFQDAVKGPVTYDLVSLLRDCYIAWPERLVDEWAWGYYQLAVQSGILRDEHEKKFLRWFDLMGAQRHLKAAGIFARLYHRDGKEGYLKDIPRTLNYIIQIAERQKDMQDLAGFVKKVVSKL